MANVVPTAVHGNPVVDNTHTHLVLDSAYIITSGDTSTLQLFLCTLMARIINFWSRAMLTIGNWCSHQVWISCW